MTQIEVTHPRGEPVRALQRGLAVLEAIATSSGEARLADIAEQAGVSRSTAHRLLATLINAGYVVQQRRSGAYRLGNQSLALAGAAQRGTTRLRAVAKPHLEQIRGALDETASLFVQEGDAVVCVEQATRPGRVPFEIGERLPLARCAAGTALRAATPAAGSRAVVLNSLSSTIARLMADSGGAAPDISEIVAAMREAGASAPEADEPAELEVARRRGYALTDEESDKGLAGVAAALHLTGRAPMGAIGIAAPATRLERLNAEAVGERLTVHAFALAQELGYQSGPA